MDVAKTLVFYIVLFYFIFKTIYTIVGIIYEWTSKNSKKGFTLNLIASVILAIFYLTIPYQIFLNFKKRKVGNVLDELVLYEYDKAASRDQTGNVVHKTILNKFLIPPHGYKFGDKDETVSGVLGINEILHYTKQKSVGHWLVTKLNAIEDEHCFISIDVDDIRWDTLIERDKILLKTKLNENITRTLL